MEREKYQLIWTIATQFFHVFLRTTKYCSVSSFNWIGARSLVKHFSESQAVILPLKRLNFGQCRDKQINSYGTRKISAHLDYCHSIFSRVSTDQFATSCKKSKTLLRKHPPSTAVNKLSKAYETRAPWTPYTLAIPTSGALTSQSSALLMFWSHFQAILPTLANKQKTPACSQHQNSIISQIALQTHKPSKFLLAELLIS